MSHRGNWRFIDLKTYDAYTNMAIDEALARSRGENKSSDTLRLYMWKPSAVTLGYFQSVEDEVDVEACRRLGVDINRRISGGGAVFNSSYGEITYSIVTSEDNPQIPHDISESYRLLCDGIVQGLAILGLESEFKPVNDIVVKGRKISGNAQIRRYGAILHHGTILVDFNAREMFAVLKVSQEKLKDKMVKQAEERVTTIRRELGREVSFEEVRKALYEGFKRSLGVELKAEGLTRYEEELSQVYRKKYASSEWIYRR
ncbi:MAG: lipoate--protein ligase family protein [Candidatus Bathyarchaeia archaeon]